MQRDTLCIRWCESTQRFKGLVLRLIRLFSRIARQIGF
nr:MAG TPA: hypothetical protein [Caudoviricetes sp.]